MESCVHLALGTAAGGLHVWRFSSCDGLTTHFSDPEAFSGCVRSLRFASRGQLLSGGDDGCLQLALVRKRRRGGTLELHEDHVTDIEAVPDPSPRVHFLSASADHSLGLWGREGGRWECRRHLRGHKAAVLSCAAHPTGRLALSIGADGTLRTWNLVRGRQAFVTRLAPKQQQRPVDVLWSPDGRRYLLVYPNCIDCYAVSSATAVEASVVMETGGVSAAVFVAPELCAVGSQERLHFVDVTAGSVLASVGVDEAEGRPKTVGRRVRWLRWDPVERLLFVLCRYSNGSSLHVLQLPPELLEKKTAVKLRALCRTELTNFRVTAFDACRFVQEKTKEEEEEEEKEEEEEEVEEIEGAERKRQGRNKDVPVPRKKRRSLKNGELGKKAS